MGATFLARFVREKWGFSEFSHRGDEDDDRCFADVEVRTKEAYDEIKGILDGHKWIQPPMQ